MTDAVQIEMIRAIPACLGSVGAVLAAWFSYRAATHSKEAVDVARKTERNTDGLADQLNALTAKSSHAQGVLDEKTRAEKQNDPPGTT